MQGNRVDASALTAKRRARYLACEYSLLAFYPARASIQEFLIVRFIFATPLRLPRQIAPSNLLNSQSNTIRV